MFADFYRKLEASFVFFFEDEADIVRFRQYFKNIFLLLIKIVEIE